MSMLGLENETMLTHISLSKGSIFMVQRLEGHWCMMTLGKGHFDLEGLEPPSPGPVANRMEQFMAVSGLDKDTVHRSTLQFCPQIRFSTAALTWEMLA